MTTKNKRYEEVLPDNNLWQPENIKESIEGKIVEIEDGIFGKQYTLKVGEQDYILPSHRTLIRRLEKLKKGDVVKVEYTGQKENSTAGKNPTNLYKVYLVIYE